MSKIVNSKIIGSKIRVLRKHAGLTQESLAELLDITTQQVQKYESGSNRLNTDRLQEVAKALNVPVQAFFLPHDCEIPQSNAEQMLLTAYRSIPNKDIQEALLKFAIFAAGTASVGIGNHLPHND